MTKQKTTRDFADWALKTLSGYERKINKIATLVLAGVADPSLGEKTTALEYLIATFVYSHGTFEEKQRTLVDRDMDGLEGAIRRYRTDKEPTELNVVFQKVWDVYANSLLSDKAPHNK